MTAVHKIFLFCALFLLFAAPAVARGMIEGKVVGISDGDTITVLIEGNRTMKVRLYGIDCPESRQAFGRRAKQFTSAYVFGKHVRVNIADTDRYGRTVGIVTTRDGGNLNRALLAAGLAWVYPKYCRRSFCNDWRSVEASARAARKGLWADKSPVPPWQFRKSKPR